MDFEMVPGLPERKKIKSKPISYERRSEKMREVQEKNEQEKEQSIKVAEKIIDDLEKFGIKCPRCGNKNVKEDKSLPANDILTHLHCLDCNNKWDETRA